MLENLIWERCKYDGNKYVRLKDVQVPEIPYEIYSIYQRYKGNFEEEVCY
jgi:hypothetical protein